MNELKNAGVEMKPEVSSIGASLSCVPLQHVLTLSGNESIIQQDEAVRPTMMRFSVARLKLDGFSLVSLAHCAAGRT